MIVWEVNLTDGSKEWYTADFVEVFNDELNGYQRIEFRDKPKSFFSRKTILKAYVPITILKSITVVDEEWYRG